MKILVLSNFSERISELNSVSSVLKQRYCDKHGYEFENLDIDFNTDNHILFLQTIKDRISKNDLVMAMGCDTAFTNFDIKIQDMAELGDPRAVISQECLGNNPINNDVMIWKNTPECIGLIDKVIADRDEWCSHGWLWQNHVAIHCLDRLKVMPARHMNSTYLPYRREGDEIFRIPCESSWQAGDWVIHALGFPTKTRADILKWAMQEAANFSHVRTKITWKD